ncbi:MAG TPA: ABC transporter permease [Bryobacteraceae bacterium]|jgi:ABC-2 type transport system permease protein
MNFTAFAALVRRDLRLFITDRRAVLMSIVAPIVIASFFGYLFRGVSNDSPASKIPISVIDEDQSEISRKVAASLTADKALDVLPDSLEPARAAVRTGKRTLAVILPKGFGDASVRAFFRGANKPEIQVLYDPSHGTEVAMVNGILTQHVMETVSQAAFSGADSERYLKEAVGELDLAAGIPAGDRQDLRQMLESVGKWNRRVRTDPQARALAGGGGLTIPYSVKTEAVTSKKGVVYNSMAHSFAGMSVQFILMMGVDAGLIVIAQRRSGIWKRLRAAPLSRFVIVAARSTSATLIAMGILFIVFGFARVVFDVKIEGSMAGFAGICAAFGLMTSAFGLLIAASGKTPEATRGLAILITLILVMLGGAWVPAFIFPQWLQNVSFAVPTRWAVDGFDAMTWRGLGFDAARGPILALLAFAAVFGALAVWRFRWEAE